jgi:hypothetical protein
MVESREIDADDAAREARECCDGIAALLERTRERAEQIGDREMLERLAIAAAAAERARELILRLGLVVQSARLSQSKI